MVAVADTTFLPSSAGGMFPATTGWSPPTMAIKHKIAGELTQMVTCQLDADQTVYANADKFRWKTTNVSIETRLSGQTEAKGKGLLAAALATATDVGKRALAGQSLAFQ